MPSWGCSYISTSLPSCHHQIGNRLIKLYHLCCTQSQITLNVALHALNSVAVRWVPLVITSPVVRMLGDGAKALVICHKKMFCCAFTDNLHARLTIAIASESPNNTYLCLIAHHRSPCYAPGAVLTPGAVIILEWLIVVALE